MSHGYGFSPVWISTWALRWATWETRKKKIKRLRLTRRVFYTNGPGVCFYLDKARAAGFTFVWFFPWVDPRVCLQIGRSVELSSTYVAVVRFLSCNYKPFGECSNGDTQVLESAAEEYSLFVYLCGRTCGWLGFLYSGTWLGSGHTCMVFRPAATVASLRQIRSWTRTRYSRVCPSLPRQAKQLLAFVHAAHMSAF